MRGVGSNRATRGERGRSQRSERATRSCVGEGMVHRWSHHGLASYQFPRECTFRGVALSISRDVANNRDVDFSMVTMSI